MADWLLTGLGALSLFALFVRALASLAVVVQPVLRRRQAREPDTWPGVTVLVPICGRALDDPALEASLSSLFGLAYERLEILFCVVDADDPAVAQVERHLHAHPEVDARLLVGVDAGGPNPKINNLGKGYRQARHEMLLFADQNLLWAPDWIERSVRYLHGEVGLVSAAVSGAGPTSFGGALECAFLNGHAAPYMLLADVAGRGFAQGISMLMRKSDLERAGGLEALHAHAGDDSSASFLMRRLGRAIVMVDEAAPQLVGSRSVRDVARRHRRWAFIRRASFPLGFHLELFTSSPVPGVLAAGALRLWTGFGLLPGFVLYVALWILLDTTASLARGWPTRPLASLVRDALMPVLWLQARWARAIDWRGTPLRISRPQVIATTPADGGEGAEGEAGPLQERGELPAR